MILPGNIINKRYQIIAKMSVGTLGTDYHAYDQQADLNISLKLIHNQFYDTRADEEALQQSLVKIQSIDHPNIARVYNFGKFKNKYYFTQEFLGGVNLRSWLNARRLNHKPFDTSELLYLLKPICESLDLFRARTMIRMITPECIHIEEDMVKVSPFGLFNLISEPSHFIDMEINRHLPYLSPEFVVSHFKFDRSTAIFSFGVLLHELLTFSYPNYVPIVYQNHQQVAFDERWVHILNRTLTQFPANRYRTFHLIQSDLTHFFPEEPPATLPLSEIKQEIASTDQTKLWERALEGCTYLQRYQNHLQTHFFSNLIMDFEALTQRKTHDTSHPQNERNLFSDRQQTISVKEEKTALMDPMDLERNLDIIRAAQPNNVELPKSFFMVILVLLAVLLSAFFWVWRNQSLPTPSDFNRKQINDILNRISSSTGKQDETLKLIEKMYTQNENNAAQPSQKPAPPVLSHSRCPRNMILIQGNPETQTESFCIDQFEYPNAKGTPPRHTLNFQTAFELCKEQSKRLCYVDEWQRACKGDRNHSYGYGSQWRKSSCNIGKIDQLQPSGHYPDCKSPQQIYDMTGNLREWVAVRFSVRKYSVTMGGSFDDADYLGLCERQEPMKVDQNDYRVGVRCCKSLD